MFVPPDGSASRYYKDCVWFFSSWWNEDKKLHTVIVTMHGYLDNGIPVYYSQELLYTDRIFVMGMDNSTMDDLLHEWGFDETT